MESTAGAFGYLSQRLQMRDCGLFGRPRSHDPLLAIWLDGFNPIGAAEWNDPVGLHEVDIATIRFGAQRLPKVRPRWSCGVRHDDPPVIETGGRSPHALIGIVRQWLPHGSQGRRPDGLDDGMGTAPARIGRVGVGGLPAPARRSMTK